MTTIVQNTVKCIFLMVLFINSTQLNAQCKPVAGWAGCANTDFNNSFMNSTSDAATIEYDNWVSAFHGSVVRQSNGEFTIWGELMAAAGTGDVASPQVINSSLYPGISGTVLKVAMGGKQQAIILTTTGLFSVGKVGEVLNNTVINTPAFTKLNLSTTHIANGKAADALPNGVTPNSVKMMFASRNTLAITTCEGNVWVISKNGLTRGVTGVTNANSWYQVKKDVDDSFLTGIVACRGSGNTLVALDRNGKMWTWGNNLYLGDTLPIINSHRAKPMRLPAFNNGATVKMIGTSCYDGSIGYYGTTYYVLATDGNLYSLGNNVQKQLGNWTTAESLYWVQPRYSSASGPVMDDIKWISPQEHYSGLSGYDEGSGAINVLTNTGILYNWGLNHRGMLGRPNGGSMTANLYDPGVPVNAGTPATAQVISATDKWSGVETGGHTTLAVKHCQSRMIFTGHQTHGSMGDNNSSLEADQYFFSSKNTATLTTCNASPAATLTYPASICPGVPFEVSANASGGSFEVLSGNATQSGSYFTSTNDEPVQLQYTANAACSSLVTNITLYKRDYGNLPAASWPVATAAIVASKANGAWLGGDAPVTGKASAECTTLTDDPADGFTIPGVEGNGTASNKWMLTPGQNYNSSITVNGSGTAKPVYWAMWYDVTGNGSFTDANDIFQTGSITHGSPVSGNISIAVPTSGTTPGTTGVLRFAATAENIYFQKELNGRVNLFNGEVEDYYVNYMSILPVSLLHFSALKKEDVAVLTWATVEEVNSKGFNIQRSTDGNNWQTIGFTASISANGNKGGTYTFDDPAPLTGKNFYRLQQVDHDGNHQYSTIQTLLFSTSAVISIYPNPVVNYVNISGLASNDRIRLYDIIGRVLLTRNAKSGVDVLDISGIANGIYYLVIESPDGNITSKKIMKVK